MRNRHLAAIPLAALLLTACASATDTAPLTTPTPEPTATATPTPAAGDFAWLNRHDSSFNSGDAYYEMVYRNHGGLLLKTDYATAAQTVACTVPGCTHDSADCPAWFPGRYRYYCPFVADGAVYVLNAPVFHTDQTWEEYREEYLTPQLDSTDLTPEELEAHYYGLWQQQSAAPQVYRLTDDGKTCIDLPAECVDYVFDFCDDAALYGVMTSGNNGQNTKAVRIDLTTGELQSVPLEPTEYFVTCYDGALLTVRYVTDAPLPDDFEQFRAAVQSATVEFDRYDPRTGERRKLIERPYNIADERLSGYLGTHNGKLYFEEREALQDGGYNRGALQEYDPADGSTATVWDAPPDWQPVGLSGHLYERPARPGQPGRGLALAVRHRRRSGRQPLLFDERCRPRACAHHPADEKLRLRHTPVPSGPDRRWPLAPLDRIQRRKRACGLWADRPQRFCRRQHRLYAGGDVGRVRRGSHPLPGKS